MTKYVIGADTSGEGSDYFTASVLDARTGEQVATLRQQFDEDLFTKQLYCLGMHYDKAMLAPECNFSSYPIKELQRLGYHNLYVREREDTYTHTMQKSFGFRTTSVTRPIIIADLVQIVRETPELINDEDTLKEMLVFIKNEKGRPEAMEGEHDDTVMALAIAHYAKNQVVFAQEPINVYPHFNFNVEKPYQADYGETITVV
jgi:phage terminase large subunit